MSKLLRIGIIISCVSYFLFTPSSIHAFSDEFDSINYGTWEMYPNFGSISVIPAVPEQDSYISLRTPSAYLYPYARSVSEIFPLSGNFELSLRFKFDNITPWGNGITFGDYSPNNDISDFEVDPKNTCFYQIWADTTNKLLLSTYDCPDTNNENCFNRRIVYYEYPNNNWHVLKLKYEDGYYYAHFDGNLVHTSVNTPRRLHHIWFGSPIRVTKKLSFAGIDIDYIRVEELGGPTPTPTPTPTPERRPVMIVPGHGASWDYSAIFTGTTGNNWQVPDWVKVYDNLISSLENLGYVRNQDLFIFAYDWRKNLSNLANDLKAYINMLGLSENIDVVAHSYGGLVTRSYMQNNSDHKVNQLVSVGTGHLGVLNSYGLGREQRPGTTPGGNR